MTTPMFVWLGSGRARKRHVAEPGVCLDQAARAGLPVPAGAIVLDEFYHFSLDKELIQPAATRLIIPDAELWHNTLLYSVRLPRFDRPVFVRALSLTAGGVSVDSNHPIDFNDAKGAAAAFEAVWSWRPTSPGRRDVLIIEAVPAALTGAATTDSAAGVDWITGNNSPPNEPQALPQLSGRRGPGADTPPAMRRLQQLLRGARRTLGPGRWRIEWADDGRICWLTGVAADQERSSG